MNRATRIRLLVFLLVGGLAVVNAGARYAGLTSLLAPNSYEVRVELDRSGGLFERAEVTWRGVTVGRVEDMEFRTHGVTAVLEIEDDHQIPQDLVAEVHNRSAVGEQYIDLVPDTAGGPFLDEGSVIPTARTSTPVEEQEVVLALHRLLTSIDPRDLAVVVGEAGRAFRGAGGDIARLLGNARRILDVARAALPDTVRLIRSSRVVLRTQADQAATVRGYLGDLDTLFRVLATHRGEVDQILADGTRAARELDKLARGLSPHLEQLLRQVVSLTRITSERLAELEETLVAVPWALASAITPGREGRAHFTYVGTPDPAPCQQGYVPPEQWRSALDPRHTVLPDDIGCDEPLSQVPRGAESVHPRN